MEKTKTIYPLYTSCAGRYNKNETSPAASSHEASEETNLTKSHKPKNG